MASQDPPPSLSTNIERGAIPRNSPPSPDEEERLDIHRLQEDAREYRKQLMRTQRATEPASAYRNVQPLLKASSPAPEFLMGIRKRLKRWSKNSSAKNEVLSELLEEHTRLKKELGES